LLKDPARPLHEPADLRHHVLLHFDDTPPRLAILDWETWLEAMGLPALKPAGVLRFNHYDQVINAAVEGHGVALGRLPLMERQLRRGQLVAPFEAAHFLGRRPRTSRAYYVVIEPTAALRPEVQHFAAWLHSEAGAATAGPA